MNSSEQPPRSQSSFRSNSILKAVAGIAALAAIAVGASAIASGSNSNTGSVAGVPQNGAAAPGTPRQGMNGVPPQGGRPGGPGGGGFGTPVTGATADKVKAAALAKYPGTLEGVVKVPDGDYVAHVIQSSGGEVHVLVNKQFQVTGARTGPPGGGARPQGGAAPPQGSGAPPQQAPGANSGTTS
jgi:hypothetical protein